MPQVIFHPEDVDINIYTHTQPIYDLCYQREGKIMAIGKGIIFYCYMWSFFKLIICTQILNDYFIQRIIERNTYLRLSLLPSYTIYVMGDNQKICQMSEEVKERNITLEMTVWVFFSC